MKGKVDRYLTVVRWAKYLGQLEATVRGMDRGWAWSKVADAPQNAKAGSVGGMGDLMDGKWKRATAVSHDSPYLSP